MKSKITFTEHFSIPKSESIEFLDIPLDEDLEAFICPFLVVNGRDDRTLNNVYNQMQSFLQKLNRQFIQANDKENGLAFLSNLHEPNEFHLGYSKRNKGKAIAKSKAEIIFDALRNNSLARQGSTITNEAHNVLLLVKGIGQDNMSDSIANVCRNLFAEFTERQCGKYSLPTVPGKIQYYESGTGQWIYKEAHLPNYNGKKIILLPKKIMSGGRAYSSLYNYFIASNYISVDILNANAGVDHESKFIHKLKDGTKKAIIKLIYKAYTKPKEKLIDFVLKYQGSLLEFQLYAKEHYPELDLSSLL
jgi:hypothetical protein